MSDETKSVLASENCHWYSRNGEPMYEVVGAKGQMRPTTLRDARKYDLVPSVTTILACAARPGLEIWKARQILEAALTLPKRDDESLDDYATRVIEDSKAQGKKASETGTELHAAIEGYIQNGWSPPQWNRHCRAVDDTLEQHGIEIREGRPEHSFASPLGYGGKIDWHNDEILIDFKTKAKVKDVKQLAWPENCWQLAAYDAGLHPIPPSDNKWHSTTSRILNVFVGVEDYEVRIHEWSPEDKFRGWLAFVCLFRFWKIKNNWNGTKP